MSISLEIFGVGGIPEIVGGEALGTLIADAAASQGAPLAEGDILVVTQKVVSKAEGMVVSLADIKPSAFARAFADGAGRDPRLVELVLRESASVVRMDAERGVIISETHHGFVCANAGIDQSNVPGEDVACLLPRDPDASARRIGAEVRDAAGGLRVPVIISDTFGRAWREGHVNFAVGVWGMEPMADYRGRLDEHGREMHVTTIAVADELAAAAELTQFKAVGVPASVVRGYPYVPAEGGGVSEMLRARARDMFR